MRNSIRWSGLVGSTILAVSQIAWGGEAPKQQISTVRVSYSDLDLRNEADAQLMHKRLRSAAFRACGGNPVLHPTYRTTPLLTVARFKECRQGAVDRAVTAIDAPVLSDIVAKAREADPRRGRWARI